MKPVASLTTIFLALVSSVHLLRVLFHVEVTAAGRAIPMWASLVAFLVTGGLAILLWRESRR